MASKKKTTKATNSEKVFKAPCQTLDCILFIKRLNPKEALDTYAKLKGIVEKLGPGGLTAYATILAYELLIDPSIIEHVEKADKEALPAVLREIYECIADLYLPYRIEYICADLNNTLSGSKSPLDPLEIFFQQLNQDSIPQLDNTPLGDEDFSWFDKMIDESISPSSSLATEKQRAPQQKEIRLPRTLKEISTMESILKKQVIGQDKAIETLVNRVKLLAVGFQKMGSFFFIGKTGVGKTELAKQAGKLIYGNFEKINCGEFTNGHEVAKLIGAPPGYMGSNQKSFFQEKAEKGNKWVFLFDEIEKAHGKLLHLLLALLDDGCITDSAGAKLDFSRSIFIFTSNQGMDELIQKSLAFGKETSEDGNKEQLKTSLDKFLSPEFRNRIDEFIYFNDLTKEDAKKIAKLHLRDLPVIISDSLLEYVVDNSYSTEYGVRSLKRFIVENIAMVVADTILASPVPFEKSARFSLRVENNKVTVDGVEGEVFIP